MDGNSGHDERDAGQVMGGGDLAEYDRSVDSGSRSTAR